MMKVIIENDLSDVSLGSKAKVSNAKKNEQVKKGFKEFSAENNLCITSNKNGESVVEGKFLPIKNNFLILLVHADQELYCKCKYISFGDMIQCDNPKVNIFAFTLINICSVLFNGFILSVWV